MRGAGEYGDDVARSEPRANVVRNGDRVDEDQPLAVVDRVRRHRPFPRIRRYIRVSHRQTAVPTCWIVQYPCVAAALIIVAIVVVLVVLLLVWSIKVIREYERAIVFRLGRLLPNAKGPGLFILIPVVDRMVKVDLRTVTLNVPPQDVITKDNVPARVNAVAYFRIVDPKAAIVQIENFMAATSQIAQTTLRAVLGQHVLDQLLSEREKINAILQEIIDEATEPWGIKVAIVEVKDVEIPSGMQRAMARQAEAERERRAKIINAEGEFQAAERLKDAALVIEQHPTALQLRYLQTLLELGGSQSTTIIFPAPIDLIRPFIERGDGSPH